jgi:predicted permease
MNDLRYAFRLLGKQPGFTAAAVLVLALAIGGNTAMFSVVNALALRPLSARNPKELVGCYSRDKKPQGGYRAFSYPNYVDICGQNTVFSSLMAHTMTMVGVAEGETTRRVFADIVSANYFSTFGAKLARGREFTADEERPGQAIPVVIVSYAYWKRTGADPGLVGRTVRLNNRVFTIVGVAPQHFTGTAALFSPEFWVPLGMYEQLANHFMNEEKRQLRDRNHHCLLLVGRLKPGLTMARAQVELESLAGQLESAYPEINKDQSLVLAELPRLSISTNPIRNRFGVMTTLLLSMSGVVLLIACLNLANMLLARGASRWKEIAIRTALGGARSRIMRQLLTEGFLLSLLGGAAGLALSCLGTQWLINSITPRIPLVTLQFSSSPDWRVLTATLGFCLLSTLLFAFGPAWKLVRADVNHELKEYGGGTWATGGRGLMALRNLVVIAQIALSLALLTGAGLFTRAALQAAKADPGFSMDRGLLAEVDAGLADYDEARGRSAYRKLLERLRALPGVQSAAMAYVVPFGLFSDGTQVRKANQSTETDADADPENQNKEKPISASINVITTDYFKTLGLRLLRGREFEPIEAESTTPAPVAIIDQVLADRLWPGEDAMGRFIRITTKPSGREPQPLQVVGVVPSIHNDLSEKDLQPHVYLPTGSFYRSQMSIHIKTSFSTDDAERALLRTVRDEIRRLDPGLPVLSLQTLRDYRDGGLVLWMVRTGARLFALFGGLALFLAVVGVYGVKSYLVAQRTREIGIRMALGATGRRVAWLMLWEGARLTLVGLLAGLLLAAAGGRRIRSFSQGRHCCWPEPRCWPAISPPGEPPGLIP